MNQPLMSTQDIETLRQKYYQPSLENMKQCEEDRAQQLGLEVPDIIKEFFRIMGLE